MEERGKGGEVDRQFQSSNLYSLVLEYGGKEVISILIGKSQNAFR